MPETPAKTFRDQLTFPADIELLIRPKLKLENLEQYDQFVNPDGTASIELIADINDLFVDALSGTGSELVTVNGLDSEQIREALTKKVNQF